MKNLREYFAAKAMQGILSNPNADMNINDPVDVNRLTKASYKIADAMMNEGSKM